jgi:ABC-type lipoprotein export system ATPase subunit
LLPKLFLPNPDGSGTKLEVEHNGSAVIVGANGAGKSRLGAWIERNTNTDIVHRISAQRALDVPEYATVKSLEQSLNDLLWGNENSQYASQQYKWSHKWGNRPETFMQQDYGKVLSTLFATTADRDRKHSDETKARKEYIPVEDAPIDVLIKLWDEVLPHREIVLADGKVKVIDKVNGTEYLGKEMSDGERVALYLMGQCLVAPSGSIFIVDEPEIHLHTSIMQSLWNKLEEAKPDCLFIYITHDLGFASTRVSSTNIWVKQFDGGNKWQWDYVPDVEDFPESLLLELMGNRRTIVFVEGEKGGKDHSIYQSIYRSYNIVPRNGCQKVIDSVKAMSLNSSFHHVNVFGIIDRDYRSDKEIEGLKSIGVHTIDVAEIENILLNESTLRIVSVNQHLDPDEVVSKALGLAKDMLEKDLERQISLRTCRAVENRLSRIDNKSVGLTAIKEAVSETINAIDIDAMYQENSALYSRLIQEDNFDDILITKGC